MPETLGVRLRRQREEQQIALGAIAEQTKIKASLLEGLERDDLSRWPSGLFGRAYIRAYAHAIGLSPDAVLREFLEIHPDAGEDIGLVETSAGADGAPATGGPPTRLRYIVGSAMASLSRLRRSAAADRVVPTEALSAGAEVNAPEADAVGTSGTSAIIDAAPEPVRVSQPEPAPDPEPDPNPQLTPVSEPAPFAPDFLELSNLCTELGCVEHADQVQSLLREAARILEAPGLIVWMWDASVAELRPALVHGYSDTVVAQLPPVPADADNVTALAFRSAESCVMAGSEHANGALVVPLMTPDGCAGVIALELPHGREHLGAVRAAATIFAALLAQVTGARSSADVRRQAARRVPPAADGTTTVLRVNARPDGHARLRLRASTADQRRPTAAERRRSSNHEPH
jgi:hypothetical protein